MKKGFILLLGIFLVGLVNALPTNVTNDSGTLYVYGCTTLNESGKYYLNQSLSTSGNCFTITANNTILDGNYSTLNGTNLGSGIFVNSSDNISLTNFSNITNFGYGVYFLGSNHSEIISLNIFSAYNDGILLENSINNTIRNVSVSFSDIKDGFHFKNCGNNTLINVSSFNNTLSGLHLETSSNNYIENSSFYSNSDWGFDIYYSGQNNTFLNLKIYNNSNSEIYSDSWLESPGGGRYPTLGNIIIYNNSYGEIKFEALKEHVVPNLLFDSNLNVSQNFVYVNSTFHNWTTNHSANITLYNIPTNADEYTILRNGVECSNCYNFTNLNAGTVVFNVSSFSNYTILAVNFSEESSSSASSSGSSYSGRTYYTNESFFEEGNIFELKRKDKVVFPVNNSSLIFKITSINIQEIKFDIYTKIKNSFIKINETKEIDVDNNSIIDLELTYLEYGESKGKIKFKSFKKEVFELEQNNTFNMSKNTEKETSEKNNFWLIFFSSLGTLLIIIVAIFAYLKFIRK